MGGILCPFFANKTVTDNNWINIQLVGSQSNRSGVGCRVVVETDGEIQTKEVQTQHSWRSQSGLGLHFGLGRTSEIDKITVYWTSGNVSEMTDIATNQVLKIEEL